jgi:predicted RNase H-like nuclease (RuvC/YqgF family)
MRIQASTLVKGQAQYKDRLNEVRILKVKIADIKREHAILSYNAKDISVLKREIHSLNKELIQEKTKVQDLSLFDLTYNYFVEFTMETEMMVPLQCMFGKSCEATMEVISIVPNILSANLVG